MLCARNGAVCDALPGKRAPVVWLLGERLPPKLRRRPPSRGRCLAASEGCAPKPLKRTRRFRFAAVSLDHGCVTRIDGEAAPCRPRKEWMSIL